MIPQENISGLEEELNDDVQRNFLSILKTEVRNYGPLRKAERFKKIGGICIDCKFEDMDGVVQTWYQYFFEKGSLHTCKELNELSGIEPNYSFKWMRDAVQKGYAKIYLSESILFLNTDTEDTIEELRKFTGITIDQKLFSKYTNNRDLFNA